MVAYRLAASAQGHSKLVQVVQASTTLPRRCRQDPGSPEGAGRLQVLPRRCRQVLLSPEGAGRCLRSCRCSNRQVSRPGVAGVVTKWCRLAPHSPEGAGRLQAPPEGAGWLQAPQKVQAGSRLPRRCRLVLLSPDGAGVVSVWCNEHQVSSRCSTRQISRPGVAGVVYRWCRVHQVSPGVPLGRYHVQVSQVSSTDGAGCTRYPSGSQVFHSAGVTSRCRRCRLRVVQ